MTAALLLALLAAAPPADAAGLLVLEPIALDALPADVVDEVGAAVAEAARARGGDVLVGRSALFATARREGQGDRLGRARQLLARGEELYMGFEYGPAAASLAESSALFGASLASLEPEDVERLYRARLLEGLAWLEAGQEPAAKDAFKKLITIRPEFEPDPALMPPRAREAFLEALKEVRQQGLATLVVRTSPPDAELFVDGLPRGRTPISVPALPAGTHGVKVVLEGYEPFLEERELQPGATETREVALVPTPLLAALNRVEEAARRGTAPDLVAADLDALARAAGRPRLALVGVAKVGDEVATIVLVRSAGGRRAVVARGPAAEAAGLAARAAAVALEGGEGVVQLPEDRRPLDVDFDAALLGVSAAQGRREALEDPGLLGSAWAWGAAGALLAGAATAAAVTAAVLLAPGPTPPADPDRVRFVLEF